MDMMNESVFFGKEGLTSTSANYYANIAQEMIQSTIERLNSVQFYQVSVAPIGSSEKQIMSIGLVDTGFITKDLEKVSQMNSFCAWVREAIKEKEEMLKTVSNLELECWAKLFNIQIPESPDFVNPALKISEEEIMEDWDVAKRNKYLRLEAFAATYGKYIHPKGSFSIARKAVHTIESRPIYKEGSGRDMVLYYQEPTIPIEDIDDLFLNLQNIYRSYEKELNAMKAELRESVNLANAKAEQDYQERMAEYKTKYTEYNTALAELRSRFNQWKTAEQERISKLRIVLPSDLLEIFEKIKKVGDSK